MPILTIVVILLMLGAVVSLIFGVLLMAKGGSNGNALENGRRQNKFMTYRIYFQAVVIILLFLVFSVTKH